MFLYRKHMREFISKILIITMLISGISPAATGAEPVEGQAPHLTLETECRNAEKDGSFDLVLEIGFERGTGTGQISRAENVTVHAEGTYGLKPQNADIEAGDITNTGTVTVNYIYEDPDGSPHPSLDRPWVRVSIESDNCGSLEYICELDVQPRARYLILHGHEDSLESSIGNSADIVENIYTSRRFDGVPVLGEDKYINPEEGQFIDSEGYLDTLRSFHTDDNDITYIYVAAHGGPDDGTGASPLSFKKKDGSLITMEELLTYVNQNVKGRVVLLFDNCYSGRAVEYAESSGMDPDRYFVASATTSKNQSSTAFFRQIMMLANLLRRTDERYNTSASCGDFKTIARGPWEIAKLVLSQCFVLIGKVSAGGMYAAASPNMASNILDMLLPDEYCEKNEALKKIKGLFETIILLYQIEAEPGKIVTKIWYSILPRLEQIDESVWEGMIVNAWQINFPQFYGNEELPICFNDTEYDDHFRLPVLLRNTEKTEVQAAEPAVNHQEFVIDPDVTEGTSSMETTDEYAFVREKIAGPWQTSNMLYLFNFGDGIVERYHKINPGETGLNYIKDAPAGYRIEPLVSEYGSGYKIILDDAQNGTEYWLFDEYPDSMDCHWYDNGVLQYSGSSSLMRVTGFMMDDVRTEGAAGDDAALVIDPDEP